MVSVDIRQQGVTYGAPLFMGSVSVSMVHTDGAHTSDCRIGVETAIPRPTVSNCRIPERYDLVSVELD